MLLVEDFSLQIIIDDGSVRVDMVDNYNHTV